MTKDTLFTLLFNGLESDNVHLVFELITQNQGLAKAFDAAQLGVLNEILNSSSTTQHPEIFKYFVQPNIYKKTSGGAGAFLNELPFVVPMIEGVERYFTSAAAQRDISGYPDCIDLYTRTGTLQGIELKNLTGRQVLRELKFGNRYEIMTHVNNFDYYRSQYLDCHLRSNSHFYNPDIFKSQYDSMTRFSHINSVFSYDFLRGLKYRHVFKL